MIWHRLFSSEKGIDVLHEIHRGRFSYSPLEINRYLKERPKLKITADFSHWTCVTESFLEGFSYILQKTIANSRHVHARVGYEEGPQVLDPRDPEWAYATKYFLKWWDQIVDINRLDNRDVLTFTTEFGPFPYLSKIPFSKNPVADQFEINCYMKDVLKDRYANE